jgi:hypothetical protein
MLRERTCGRRAPVAPAARWPYEWIVAPGWMRLCAWTSSADSGSVSTPPDLPPQVRVGGPVSHCRREVGRRSRRSRCRHAAQPPPSPTTVSTPASSSATRPTTRWSSLRWRPTRSARSPSREGSESSRSRRSPRDSGAAVITVPGAASPGPCRRPARTAVARPVRCRRPAPRPGPRSPARGRWARCPCGPAGRPRPPAPGRPPAR